MDLISYIPSMLSIYLILISRLPNKYLIKSVDNFTYGKGELYDKKTVISHIALTWSAKIGFLNSMFSAFFSSFSIFSSTQNYLYLVITITLLLMIFIPMFWYIISHEADALTSQYTRIKIVKHLTHSDVCSCVLILINIILMIAIMISQLALPGEP